MHICLKQYLSSYKNYVLYRRQIFKNVIREIKVHSCNLVVISLKSYMDMQYVPKLR